ncbi:hypothetical protein LOD99_7602 [Oopsacas minuta]|uniref:Uncharacterized protein n=1 Tax=Oopsacas minuta TaxID=111878 RepID=A0AAV7JNJ6_9METZ|nr:hypothetical protein LOD99_7602 [Oopsacas minuta]
MFSWSSLCFKQLTLTHCILPSSSPQRDRDSDFPRQFETGSDKENFNNKNFPSVSPHKHYMLYRSVAALPVNRLNMVILHSLHQGDDYTGHRSMLLALLSSFHTPKPGN